MSFLKEISLLILVSFAFALTINSHSQELTMNHENSLQVTHDGAVLQRARELFKKYQGLIKEAENSVKDIARHDGDALDNDKQLYPLFVKINKLESKMTEGKKLTTEEDKRYREFQGLFDKLWKKADQQKKWSTQSLEQAKKKVQEAKKVKSELKKIVTQANEEHKKEGQSKA